MATSKGCLVVAQQQQQQPTMRRTNLPLPPPRPSEESSSSKTQADDSKQQQQYALPQEDEFWLHLQGRKRKRLLLARLMEVSSRGLLSQVRSLLVCFEFGWNFLFSC